MRVGVKRTAAGPFAEPSALLDVVRATQALGYGSYWLGDHISFPDQMASIHPGDPWPTDPKEDFLEALGTAGFLLGQVDELAIGVNCLIAPYRNPIVVAKTIATLDHLSAGRFRVALSAGWLAETFPMLGAPPFSDRGKALEEYVAVLRSLWEEDMPSFSGAYYSFPPSHFHPRPRRGRRIPILLGGHSTAALARAARIGDGWSAPRLTPEQIAGSIAEFRTMAEQDGRDPGLLEISVISDLRFQQTPSDQAMLTGTPEQVRAAAAAYRDAGVTHLHVNPIARPPSAAIADLERFRLLADDVPGLEFAR